MVKANGYSALPVTPDGFAWDSCHPTAVAVAHPRSHIIPFLAPLGQAQPSVQGPQWPCESTQHVLSSRALLILQTPGASEMSPGGDGLYLGKHSNMRNCLPREGVEKGGVRGRGRARIRSGAEEGITKCLPLWRNRLEMISHCSCFDSPNTLARTISQSR